jgi:hypothetical protein
LVISTYSEPVPYVGAVTGAPNPPDIDGIEPLAETVSGSEFTVGITVNVSDPKNGVGII